MARYNVAFVLLVSAATCGFSQAAIISDVRAINSTATPRVESLFEGINAYYDETPGHRLVNLICPIVDRRAADVVVSSNVERTNSDYQLEITIDRLTVLYIYLDDRHGDSQPLDWMQDGNLTGLPTTFFDTGLSVDIDANSTLDTVGDSIDGSFSVWVTLAPPGTYTMYSQNFGEESFQYIAMAHSGVLGRILACVPEPTSVSLVLVAAFCMSLRFRRVRCH